MTAYAEALLYAIPGFIGLILIELVADIVTGKRRLKGFDTISSLCSGITNVTKSLLGLIILIAPYPYLLDKLALLPVMEMGTMALVVGFVAKDFAGYWNHRLSHQVNYFWNRHIVHHSSEEFNLACALRQSVSEIFGFYGLFLIPAAVLGVPHGVIAILAPIHLFLQFWYHTQYIGKLGLLEYLIITPSQHRVHHAINRVYLDKNLGQIFSIWDRLFGTYQEELESEPCVYGVTRPVSTWNPIKINFIHLWLLIQDAWRTHSWRDKLRIWIMPTGWRPQDVADQYPVRAIKDIFHFHKYNSRPSSGLVAWSWIHFVVTLLLALFMLYQIKSEALDYSQMLFSSGMLFLNIYGFTSLMDQDRQAVWFEVTRGILGIGWVVYSGGWFGLENYLPMGGLLVAAYYTAVIAAGISLTMHFPSERDISPQPLQ